MRSSVAMRLSKALSILCSAVLCCSLIPTYAFASQKSLSLIPEGEQGAARIVSGAEGGALDTFSHCASDGPSSVDAGGAAIPSEDVDDTEREQGLTHLRGKDILSQVVELEDGLSFVQEESRSEQALETSERGTFYSDAPTYNIVFDANGGDYAPEGAAYMAAFGGRMPSIEGALHRDAQGNAVPPVRNKFVFMGWYDGSDYAHAERFYTRDFTVDATCVQTYPYPADGLRLYAGWAPVIDVDVPAAVSISVGTVLAMDGPSVTSDAIVNRSPWPIRCTSLSWDDTELPVTDSDLLAFEVEMGAGTLDTMFSDANGASGKNGVYLMLTPVLPSAPATEVQPGGTVALGDASALTVAAATEAVPESRLPIDYSLRLANGIEVASTEKVSKTRLVTSYEAVVAPADDTRSSVMFSANGGVGGQSKSLPGVKGAAMPELTDKSTPVYEGREFMGWYDDPVYTRGTRYYDASGEAVSGRAWDKDAACVLYAGWKTKGCTVVLVAGPDGSTASMSYDAVVPSSTYEVLYDHALSSVFGDDLPVPYWESGYVFCGWWTERVGGERVYANAVMKDYGNPTVLYGRWSGFPVAVTWDPCGGSEVGAWSAHPAGSVLGTLPETSRAGYAFVGWFTQPSGGIRIDETTVISDIATFYAQWTPDTITLSWDLDGIVTTSTQTYGDGATVRFPEGLAAPSKDEGWLFRGWYERDTAGDSQGMPVSTTTPLPAENTTYAAFWDVEVTFDANGGVFAEDKASATSFQHAGGTSKLQLPETPAYPDPDFELVGWYTDAATGAKVDATTPVSAPATYYAHWSGPALVSFDGNGATGGTVPSPVKAFDGVVMTLPNEEPERTGYDFLGWASSASATEAAWQPGGDYTGQGEDPITLYAVWKLTVYALTYELNGGTVVPAGANPTTYTIESNDIVLVEPTYPGHTFQGWSGTNLTDPTKTVTVPKGSTGDRSYTANWIPWTYTVLFKDTSGATNPNPTGPAGFNKVIAGESYVIPENIEWSWSAHEFLGWSLIDGAKEPSYQSGGTIAAADVIDNGIVVNGVPTLYVYPVWKLTYGPVPYEELSEEDKGFYLPLPEMVDTDDLTMEPGCYGASQIKQAALDISDKGEDSIYYDAFKTIMEKDYKFKSRWYNVSSDNANTHLNTTYEYDIRIIGLRQDYANEKKTTFAGMTFQFGEKALSFNYRFNNSNTNVTGWKNSELRARLNPSDSAQCSPQSALTYGDPSAKESIWNRAPMAIQNHIQPVYKLTHNAGGTQAADVTSTRDLFFLASYWEIASKDNKFSTASYPWITGETVSNIQYQYWKSRKIKGSSSNSSLLISWCRNQNPDSGGWSSPGAAAWWERTVYPGDSRFFMFVAGCDPGYNNNENWAATARTVVPCFCF